MSSVGSINPNPIACSSICACDLVTPSLNSSYCSRGYNVFETITGYEVEIPLPGISSDEVKVFYEANELRVVAHPKDDGTDREKKIVTVGFYKGDVECTVKIPCCESVDAEMKNGILYVHASKKLKGIEVAVRTA